MGRPVDSASAAKRRGRAKLTKKPALPPDPAEKEAEDEAFAERVDQGRVRMTKDVDAKDLSDIVGSEDKSVSKNLDSYGKERYKDLDNRFPTADDEVPDLSNLRKERVSRLLNMNMLSGDIVKQKTVTAKTGEVKQTIDRLPDVGMTHVATVARDIMEEFGPLFGDALSYEGVMHRLLCDKKDEMGPITLEDGTRLAIGKWENEHTRCELTGLSDGAIVEVDYEANGFEFAMNHEDKDRKSPPPPPPAAGAVRELPYICEPAEMPRHLDFPGLEY